MILQRIVEFAERQETSLPTGYQPRFVNKEIALNLAGELVSVIPLSGETRGKRSGRTRPEPQESPMRTVAIKPRLFADNVNHVLGKRREKDKPDQVAKRHEAWLQMAMQAADANPTVPEFAAVARWINQGGPAALRDDARFDEADEITLTVDGKYLTDLPETRCYWTSLNAEGTQALCLVTGKVGPVVDRMPAPIKGVPDGQMSGTALISVNNAAGESYGLEAALNSPVSVDAAEKLCNGLNVLLNEEAGVTENGKRKFRYSLRIGKAVYVAWCRHDDGTNYLNSFSDPAPENVQKYLIAAQTGGKKVGAPEAADFFALCLSANSARIVVRDYHETTLDTVKVNLGKWFGRLQIISTDGEPARPLGIYQLAASLYRDASKEMPAHVPTSLLTAALSGRPIPEYILGLAVKRNLAMQGPFYTTKAKTKAIATARLALIKAALTPNSEDTTLNQLNPEHPNPAYQCGRMLAVLEAIQRVAVPGLNATLTDRFYGAACASPATVFGNLLKDATSAHLPKLRKNRPGAHHALDTRLQEVAGAIGGAFPRTLALKDQALFALGYYHQKAFDVSEAKKNKELKELAEATVTTTEETEK